MSPVVVVLAVIILIEAAWWIVWMTLALWRKIYANFYFMLAVFVVWGVLAFIGVNNTAASMALEQEAIGWLILLFILAMVPFILLPGMVTIINEYQRGVLFRLDRLVGLYSLALTLSFLLV